MSFISKLFRSSYQPLAGEDKPVTQKEKDEGLIEAAYDNEIDAVRDAIKFGANVNCAEFFTGSTPLHIAVDVDNLEIVKLLIEGKADTSQQDTCFRTPMQLALVLNRRDDIKKILIDDRVAAIIADMRRKNISDKGVGR